MSRKRSLYRTVLGVAIAALLAAWLPFSVLYVEAVTKHAAVSSTTGRSVITTKASGAPTITGGTTPSAAQTTPVRTRAS